MQVELSPHQAAQVAEEHGLSFDADRHELRLFRGDTRLAELVLDRNVYVIVEGDLTVDGPIIDYHYNNDDVSHLTVSGHLTAANMITGQSIDVGGNLTVSTLWFVLAWDDLTRIRVQGTAAAAAFISIGAEPITVGARKFRRVYDSLDEAATTHSIEAILLPGLIDPRARKNLAVLSERMLARAVLLGE